MLLQKLLYISWEILAFVVTLKQHISKSRLLLPLFRIFWSLLREALTDRSVSICHRKWITAPSCVLKSCQTPIIPTIILLWKLLQHTDTQTYTYTPNFLQRLSLVSVFVQALLASSGQDRSTGLEAHLVSANSRYIQEQQEQQQVRDQLKLNRCRAKKGKQKPQMGETWEEKREGTKGDIVLWQMITCKTRIHEKSHQNILFVCHVIDDRKALIKGSHRRSER